MAGSATIRIERPDGSVVVNLSGIPTWDRWTGSDQAKLSTCFQALEAAARPGFDAKDMARLTRHLEALNQWSSGMKLEVHAEWVATATARGASHGTA